MNKIRVLVSTLCVMLLLSSCSKKDNDRNCSAVNVVAPANETAALKAYIDSNHIDAVADPRGFYYKITAAGTGNHPNVCSGVIVTYTAKLTNGTEVDSGTDAAWDLYALIIGWQEGIPLIAKSGSIILYLPPSLGYGAAGAGAVPPNSILVFNITLTSTY
ncbi:FKBP-type peptidyl-prolyl cis-trans isomerase [Ilyomonas limi]|nr:FKBP-type peptidyl-prolyl cis-trans isomerase [Ilyomonas limi]